MSVLRRVQIATVFCVLGSCAEKSSQRWYPNSTLPVMGSQKQIPMLGFGTCCRKAALGRPLIESIKLYLSFGGRHIDTAWLYGNHKDIGTAIRESQIPRHELWITSKIMMGFGGARLDVNHAGEPMKKAQSAKDAMYQIDRSLEQLGLEYLDLMLLHSPAKPQKVNAEIWQAAIEAKQMGKLRNIGVSQHQISDIQALQSATGVLPSVNQIPFHPWMPEPFPSLVSWCQRNDIVVVAFNSFKGSAGHEEETAMRATQASLTSSQWLLQWALERNVVVIPGATSADHIRSNLMLGSAEYGAKEL